MAGQAEEGQCMTGRGRLGQHRKEGRARSSKAWTGRKTSLSLLRLRTWVSDLEFVKPSVSATIVVKTSHVSFAEPRFMR